MERKRKRQGQMLTLYRQLSPDNIHLFIFSAIKDKSQHSELLKHSRLRIRYTKQNSLCHVSHTRNVHFGLLLQL